MERLLLCATALLSYTTIQAIAIAFHVNISLTKLNTMNTFIVCAADIGMLVVKNSITEEKLWVMG
jgi:hypothetical protein